LIAAIESGPRLLVKADGAKAPGRIMSAHILVAEDDTDLSRALHLAFSLEGYTFTPAYDGEAALRLFDAEHPDLVVLDVSMPQLDGFTVCERIRANSAVPILMLTARGALEDKVSGLKHGADDYLVKPFAVEELLARIDALLRRHRTESSGLLSLSDLRLDPDSHEAYRGDRPLHLTPREFQLLSVLLRNPRQVLSRDQLCEQVWGYTFRGESNFIDVTVKGLRRKLEEGGESRLIQTVRGFGYSLRED